MISFDEEVDEGDLVIGKKPYNYNTLEPNLLKVNGLKKVNDVLGVDYEDEDSLRKYMHNNKTLVGLKFFETEQKVKFPGYIILAVT